MKMRLLPLIIVAYIVIAMTKIGSLITGFTETKSPEMSIISELNPKIAVANEKHEAKPPKDAEHQSGAKEKSDEHGGKDAKKPEDPWKKHERVFDRDSAKISNIRPQDTSNLQKECSDVEIDLLRTLSKRREELDVWAKDAQNKENVLKAAELKIDNKLSELKALKEEVTNLLNEYNDKENIKIKSLVKIYESMKPKDAAQIFERLDMPVLLQVIDHMKEVKVAPILANVNPQRAKEITIEFANQKRLPDASSIK